MDDSEPIVIPFTRLFRIFEKVVDPTGKSRNRKFCSSIEMEQIIMHLIFYCKNVPPNKCCSLFNPLQRKTGGDSTSNWFRILESIPNSKFDKYNKANQLANMCYIPSNFDQVQNDNPQLIQQATGIAFVLDLIYYSMGKCLKDENLKVYHYSEYFKKWFFINFFENIPKHDQQILVSFDPKLFGLDEKDFPNLGTRPFSNENWNGIINVSHTEQSVNLLKNSSEFKTAQRITEDFATTSDAIEKLQKTIDNQRKDAERYEKKMLNTRHEMYKNILELERKQVHLKELGVIINDGVLANDQQTLEESVVGDNESTCSQSSKYKLAKKEIKIPSLGLELSEDESTSTLSIPISSPTTTNVFLQQQNVTLQEQPLIGQFPDTTQPIPDNPAATRLTTTTNSQPDESQQDLSFGSDLLVPDDVIDMSYGQEFQ